MHKFVVCLDNKDYEASLEKRKLYEVIPDPEALKHNQIRVIDESGGSAWYPFDSTSNNLVSQTRLSANKYQ